MLARHFEGSQKLSWPRNATFRQRLNFGETLSEEVENVLGYLIAQDLLGPEMPLSLFWQDTFSASSESVSPKLRLCQNAKNGISGPRKFSATFKVSPQNKP